MSEQNDDAFDQLADDIADALFNQGRITLDNILPSDITTALLNKAIGLGDSQWRAGGIGRGNQHQQASDIRNDVIHWLDYDDAAEQHYLAWLERMRVAINRRLLLGLFDSESHYANYQPGDFYKKHIDAFKGRSNRVLTIVYYLNEQWLPQHGGALKIYSAIDGDDRGRSVIESVLPQFGKMVIFLSEKFPHEVEVTQQSRYSIATWYRING
jgi:SM-20-related protein